MNDPGVILAAITGILVGIIAGLLFFMGKNRQLAENLRSEAERRAIAEEKSSRVPALEENLDKEKQENSLLLAKMSELELPQTPVSQEMSLGMVISFHALPP